MGKLRHLETHTLWVQEKVRTGAITVKKVRGEVNPADLFTKHLPSREKVHQLLGLFGCEYRGGRAAAALLLRPMDIDGRQGAHSTGDDPLPTFYAEIEAGMQDISRLPHMHSELEIEKLFPTITAADEPDSLDDWSPDHRGDASQPAERTSRKKQLQQRNAGTEK